MSIGEMDRIKLDNTSKGEGDLAAWTEDGIAVYHCDICFIREDDGSYSAVVMNLPGAGSCGATIEEAERNAKEAVQGVIESHNALGENIPWENSVSCDTPEGSVARKWILVDA